MKENVFSIKENNVGCKEVCPICGHTHKPSINYTIFDDQSGLPICEECQGEYTPNLRQLLNTMFNESGLPSVKEYINGIEVQRKTLEYELNANDVFDKMIEAINNKSDLNLTREHISFGIDDETHRFHFIVNDDAFSDDEWYKCEYDLNQWYETFDLVLFEMFKETLEISEYEFDKFSHLKYRDSDEIIIIAKKY